MAQGIFGTSVSAGQIAQTKIAPTSLPGSTYVKPQQREVGTNLNRLAQSLGNLNGALSQFAAVSNTQDKDPNSEANRAFLDSIQGIPMDELARRMPEAKNRIQKDGVLSLVGSKAASEFRDATTEWYNTEFDQSAGNFPAEVEARRQEYAEGLEDPAMKAAFFRETENFVSSFSAKDTERKVANATADRDTAVVDHFRNMIDDGIEAKLPPEEIAAAILKESSLSRDFFAMDGKSQNATLFNIASEYAQQGRPELAKAILDGDRVGSDGAKIGPVSKTSEYAQKSAKLIEDGINVQTTKSQAASFGVQQEIDTKVREGSLTKEYLVEKAKSEPWMTPQYMAGQLDQSARTKENIIASRAKEEDRLRTAAQARNETARIDAQVSVKATGDGGLDDLQDIEVANESGGVKTYTAQAQKEKYTAKLTADMEAFKEKLIDAGVEPKEADRQTTIRSANEHSRLKIENRVWVNQFNGIAASASVIRAAEKGEAGDQLVDTVEKFFQIEAVNPAYAESLIKGERDKAFYQMYSDARKYNNLNPQAALLEAAQGTNRSITQKASKLPPKADVEDRTEKVLKDLKTSADATGADRGLVHDRITKLISRGASPEAAADRAKQEIEDNSFVVHGRLVMDDQSLPQDAPVLFESLLASRHEVFGKQFGIEDPEDLYLEASGPGQWIVMSKQMGGVPIGQGSVITSQELRAERGRVARGRQELLEKVRTASAQEKVQLKREYDDGIAKEWKHIETLKGRKGKLSKKLGSFLEGHLNRRINEANPFWVSTQKTKAAVEKQRIIDLTKEKFK